MLTHSELLQLLSYDPDTGLLTRLTDNHRGQRIGSIAGSKHHSGYIEVMVKRVNYRAHRICWFHAYGVWPTHDIDHINGDKADNRLCNLRDAPTLINAQNERRARKNSSSGLMGATFRKDRNKWIAAIRVNGKTKRLGSFATPEEAHSAYLEGKRLYHAGFTL